MSEKSKLDIKWFDGLLSDVLEGTASSQQLDQLNVRLREDPEARSRYISFFDLHASLADPAGPLQDTLPDEIPDILSEVIDQALEMRRLYEISDQANQMRSAQQAKDSKDRRAALRPNDQRNNKKIVVVIPKAVVWLSLAALLGLVIWVGSLVTPESSEPFVDSVPQVEPSDPQRAPSFPAMLIASHQAVWSRGAERVASDGSLASGLYGFEDGYVHIEMADGAELIVEGPATFSIDSASGVSLSRGTLAAYVPEGAEGFAVDTPAGRVLDLGTEFGVMVDEGLLAEVHVLQGMVTATLIGTEQTAKLGTDTAARMDAAAGTLDTTIAPRGERFTTSWAQATDRPRTTGGIAYLYRPPGSVRGGAMEDNSAAYLIPERAGVALTGEIRSLITQPGTYVARVEPTGVIETGKVVDSYLLHFDPVGAEKILIQTRGVVHFDRPVLGVVVTADGINGCDQLFAAEAMLYPTSGTIEFSTRGIELGTDDRFTLSADRKTLTFQLSAADSLDQVRILVKSRSAS